MPKSATSIKLKRHRRAKLRLSTRYLIPYACLSALTIIGLAALCPFALDNSSAEETPSAASPSTRATVDVHRTLSVSLSPTVEMSATPNPDGVFTSGNAGLKVSTNNSTGYTVYINTSEPTTAMRTKTSTDEITALTAPTTAAGFEKNTWGYNLSKSTDATENANYTGITLEPAQIDSTDHNTGGENYTLAFGTKVDNTITAGKYSNKVTVSVIANPFEITELSEATYMQDMTSDICTNTGEITPGQEVEKQLIDVRDGKKYWVAKLADQNCWMTQNLALDLNEQTLPLTSSTSDVSQDWHPASETSSVMPTTAAPYNGTASWNLGNYVFATPQHSTPDAITDFSQCSLFQEVSNWSPSFTAKSGQWGDYTGYIAADATSQTYDPRYTVGNFYQFNTATAGSSTISSDPSTIAGLSDAKDSVCPKGWQLPVSGNWSYPDTVDREDSFYRLIRAYGYPSVDSWTKTSWALETPFKLHERNYIAESPIHFPAVGMINMENLKIHGASGWGYSWTSTNTGKNWLMPVNSYNTTKVYITEVRSENGLPVRCLAK